MLQSIVINKVPGALEALDMHLFDEILAKESAETAIAPTRENLFFHADANFLLFTEKKVDALRYLGVTTDLNADNLRMIPRYRNGVFNLPIDRDPANKLAITVANGLCSLEIHTILGHIYFNSIHPYFPMLDRRDYFENLATNNSTTEFILLKCSLSAVVAQIITFLPALDTMSPFALSKKLIKFVKSELPDQFDRCGIMTVQTCVLLSICGMASFETINPYVYICNFNRMYD